MATLRQSVERLRDRGTLPTTGTSSLRDLNQRYQPLPSGSTRALLAKMLDGVSEKRPCAVILCRFKGSSVDVALEGPIESFFRGILVPGTGGLIEYWRDVSLGAIDITGSKVFGWVEVDIPRDQAGGTALTRPPGPGREGLARAAIDAVKREQGADALKNFLGPIAIYTQNWSKDGAPPGADWQTPGWFQFWIDGGEVGDNSGEVSLTPPHDGNITAHEMGHSFGMQHDVSADLTTHYADPCCIMSQNNPFRDPTFMRNFGPSVCLPHLVQQGWMYNRRLSYDAGDWMSRSDGITLSLAPLTVPQAGINLGIKLAFKQGTSAWDYYLQYVTPTGWDRGIRTSFLFIRRIATANVGPTSIYLGAIAVPDAVGVKAAFVEPTGNVRFEASLSDLTGPVLTVTAKKL